jgi:hypothetical protein
MAIRYDSFSESPGTSVKVRSAKIMGGKSNNKTFPSGLCKNHYNFPVEAPKVAQASRKCYEICEPQLGSQNSLGEVMMRRSGRSRQQEARQGRQGGRTQPRAKRRLRRRRRLNLAWMIRRN